MSTFLKFLDISSFFIIIVINLSLIALLCYYVKRKFEHVEEIQNQQAKILFDLVNKPSGDSSESGIDSMFLSVLPSSTTNVVDIVKETSDDENKVLLMNDSEVTSEKYKTFFDEKTDDSIENEDSDSDSDSDSESDEENMVGVADKLLMSTRVNITEDNSDDEETVMDEDSDDSDSESEEDSKMIQSEVISLPSESIIEEIEVDEVPLTVEATDSVSQFNKFNEDFGDEFQSKVIHLGDEVEQVIQLDDDDDDDESLIIEKEHSDETEIEKMKVSELKALAEEKGIKLKSGMKKQDIINEMMKV